MAAAANRMSGAPGSSKFEVTDNKVTVETEKWGSKGRRTVATAEDDKKPTGEEDKAAIDRLQVRRK